MRAREAFDHVEMKKLMYTKPKRLAEAMFRMQDGYDYYMPAYFGGEF